MKVKKLVFEEMRSEIVATITTDILIIKYIVETYNKDVNEFRVYNERCGFGWCKVEKVGVYHTLSEGKVAAQEHFEKLINTFLRKVTI